MPSRGKPSNVSDEAYQGSRGQQPHPGDRTQVLDGGKLLDDRLQLPLDLLDPSFDLADLATGLGEDRSQGLGQIGVGVLDERPRGGIWTPPVK